MPTAVAFRYARALVDVVTSGAGVKGDPRLIGTQLKEFDQMLRSNGELQTLFTTPAVSAAKKRAVLASITPKLNFEEGTGNFLKVILEHERMPQLGDIAEAYELLLNERLGVVVVEVRSARPLQEAEKQELAEALRKRTGKEVRMNLSLDASLIGGVVAQVGSTIYDGSVRGQLERLRAELAGQLPGQAAAAFS
jgi:F-type H+-transporting ATPase subunit delta